MRTLVDEDRTTPSGGSPPAETVRDGPWRTPAALETEVDAHRAELADERDDPGQRLAGRGRHRSRQVVDAPRRVAPVRAGARLRHGRLVGHPEAVAA
ncbi:hypothetical protein GCM10010300_60890 [Streptomyces olivaceoviridis]|uniref:hypothetical protein n=1 Tax=Streptomyces olivaceoviridis TaxID=1921 RepID=UPI001673A39C|nr:hypothetical protein [Streptomyces olivaceoviridis]GGZ08864.1 hypothetical protein GCM10010300_60890 [Streptomyces olivaceoviridis]